MKAAVVREPGKPMVIENIDIADPKAGEVKVKILASGLCHTDISAWHGYLPVPVPIVLGHEGVGIVEKAGDMVTSLKPGDKVLINALVYCGECPDCEKGPYGTCSKNFPLMFGGALKDGTTRLSKGGAAIHSFFCQSAFAEYCVTDQAFAVKLPDDVPAEKLVALCCGGATGIGAVLKKARVWPGAYVAVYGCGGVGISAIIAAKLSGAAKIIAIDILDNKLKLTGEFGATHTINSSKVDPVEAVREITGSGVDFSIEAIGRSDTVSQCVNMLKPGGTAVVVGAPGPGVAAAIEITGLLAEKTVTGSTIGSLKPQFDIPRLIELFKQGRLPVDRLVQAEYPLDKINEAFAAAEKSEFIKAIIKP
jgi:Zn-dependent alcohol dehydrogenase